MPVFTEGQDPLDQGAPAQGRMPSGQPSPDPFLGPTPGETIGAAFRLDNPVVGVLDALSRSRPDATPVPGYNPLKDGVLGTKYADQANQFYDFQNPAQTAALKAQIDAKEKDGQTLSAAGTPGTVAGIGAGLLDPFNFVPVIGELNVARDVGAVARGALRFGAQGAAAAAASEVVSHATDPTRTWQESAGNIASGTLLMGIFGGAHAMLSPVERATMAATMDEARPKLAVDPETGVASPLAPGQALIPAEPALVASRRFPDGTIKLARPGQIHADLMTSAELKTDTTPPEIDAQMGFSLRGNDKSFLTRDEALKFAQRNEPNRAGYASQTPQFGLEASTYNEARAGSEMAVGAAPADTRDLVPKGYGLNQIPGVKDVANNVSPNARVYAGSSVEAKRAMADLSETAIRMEQHDEGVPTALNGPPLEGLVRVQQNQLMIATHDILEHAWVEHYYGDTKPNALTIAAGKEGIGAPTAGDKLSFADFKSAMYDAGVSGDQHPVPEVQQAMQQLRARVLDPVKQFAQTTTTSDGKPMLSTELDAPAGDQSFMPRQYVRDAAIAKHDETVQRITNWLQSEQTEKAAIKDRLTDLQAQHEALGAKVAASEQRLASAAAGSPEHDLAEAARLDAENQRAGIRNKMEEEIRNWKGKSTSEAVSALKARDKAEAARGEGKPRLAAADGPVDRAVKRILASDRDLSRQELESRAKEVMGRLISSPDGRVPYDAPSGGPKIGAPGTENATRGALNSRGFAMPTSQFPAGVINKDVEHVMSAHLRTMLPDIHLTARFGDVDMTNTFKKIQEEYANKIGPKTTEAQAAKLFKERDEVITDIAKARDRLRGTAGWNPDPTAQKLARIVHDFQNATALSSLGTSAINRLTDLGANSVFRYGLGNVFNDVWAPFFTGMLRMSPVLGIAKQQARDMGIGVDGLLGHMRHNLHDVNDAYQSGNKWSRGLAWLADKSMIVNGHGPWTDYMKAMAVNVAQGELGRMAKRIVDGSSTKRDLQSIADMNIDRSMAGRISAQYEQHHLEVSGRKFADTTKWTDRGARQAFEAAMSREANISVVTAGIGDKPNLMSTPIGGLITQFHGFTAGSHEKILISNMQQRDGRVLQGVLTSVAMGMLSYRLYTLASGQSVSENPADWIKEGISRSAMTGWLGEANQVASKFSGGKLDYNRVYGATAPLTRRADNSPLSELLGPTYSRLEGLAGIVSHVASGNATANDVHQARMALPLQNLMGLRILFDQVEDGVSGMLGMKPRNRDLGAGMPPH